MSTTLKRKQDFDPSESTKTKRRGRLIDKFTNWYDLGKIMENTNNFQYTANIPLQKMLFRYLEKKYNYALVCLLWEISDNNDLNDYSDNLCYLIEYIYYTKPKKKILCVPIYFHKHLNVLIYKKETYLFEWYEPNGTSDFEESMKTLPMYQYFFEILQITKKKVEKKLFDDQDVIKISLPNDRNCADCHTPALGDLDQGKCVLVSCFYAMLAIKYYKVKASTIEAYVIKSIPKEYKNNLNDWFYHLYYGMLFEFNEFLKTNTEIYSLKNIKDLDNQTEKTQKKIFKKFNTTDIQEHLKSSSASIDTFASNEAIIPEPELERMRLEETQKEQEEERLEEERLEEERLEEERLEEERLEEERLEKEKNRKKNKKKNKNKISNV